MAVIPRNPARWRSRACAALLLPLLALGCSTPWTGLAGPSFDNEPASHLVAQISFAPLSEAQETIRLTSHQDGDNKEPADDKKNGHDKKDDEPKEKITLPRAIQMCIAQNYRLRAGAERIRQAEAELVTASLIPNMSVYTDYQLIPLQTANIQNELGPPQADVLLTVPIDWLLFGKRVAAMQAARLGIDVSSADYADLHRIQVARTVDSFYENLETKAYLDLAEDNLAELQEIEKTTQMLAKNKKAGRLELDRIKLAVHEALLERHDRELAWDVARTRLRPLIGRTAADAEYDLDGKLAVAAVVPPPTLKAALALADAHRADLISDRLDIDRARAALESERRKARPSVMLHPMYTYQNQEAIDGFRNGSMAGFGLTTTLPLTDRNQGNILKARSRQRELQHIYQGDRADVFAEVEASVAEYSDAVEHITLFDTPETMKAAHDLQKNMTEAFLSGERRLHDLLNAHHAYRERLAHVVEFQSTYLRKLNKLNMMVGLNAYDQTTGATQRIVYPK